MIQQHHLFIALAAAWFATAAAPVYAQQTPESKASMENCPMHQKHMQEMNERGNQAMGFDQAKTAHHFILRVDGGVIQVEANDPKDTTSRDQIRQHLSQITKMFAAGDFSKPLAVHAQVPPGVETMKKLKAEINYSYEEIEGGARLRISSANPEALAAIHEFLKFQINEHQTGDPLEIRNQK